MSLGAARQLQTVFPFFVGCGRSGTTLLRAIFDSHPAMSMPAETQFILSMGMRRRRYEGPDGIDIDRFLTDVYRFTDLHERWGLPREDVRSAWSPERPRNYPDAIRALFALQAGRSGKSRYGNKTPIHVLSLPQLARLFPEARFVHVLRDGRDVALSYLASDFGPDTVEGAALRWRHWTGRGVVAGRRLGPERYREITYEALVEDPERVAREVCEFVRLDFDGAMLRYADRADEILAGVTYPHHHQSLRLRPTKGLRDWRSQMSPDDVVRFEALAGGLLSELGYERRARTVGMGRRARALWLRSASDFRQAVGGVRRTLVSG